MCPFAYEAFLRFIQTPLALFLVLFGKGILISKLGVQHEFDFSNWAHLERDIR